MGASGHPTYSLRLWGPTARSLGEQIVGSRSGYRPGTDLFSCISARANESALKKPKSAFFRSCWQVLEGHARAFLLFGWLRGKRALPGCPAHRGRCRLRALPMEFPRFSRILAFFQNTRKVKHRKTHSFGVDRRPAPTSISRCLKLPCL